MSYPYHDPLNASLQGQPSLQTRSAFINEIWAHNLSNAFQTLDVSSDCYFRYFEKECSGLLIEHGRWAAKATYRDVADIIHDLGEGLDRESIEERLQKRFPLPDSDDDSLKSSCNGDADWNGDLIGLAARLLLMIPFGGFRQISTPGTSITWETGSLAKLLELKFQKQKSVTESVKLEKAFNLRSLERIGGIRIIWTNNLLDHLRLQDDDTRLSIFHHATFLHYHKTKGVFPPSLMEETLRTLALLLPRHDKTVTRWFSHQAKQFGLDTSATLGAPLNTEDRHIEKFEFWHDRLVILKEVFDGAEPATLRQWWEDRRKRVQWYTFWVAAMVLGLTVFFGVVQSVEGGMQAWKAYHP